MASSPENLNEVEIIMQHFKEDGLHDLALMVEDQEIWVPRQTLALYSPVFNEMLFGQFKESRENRINLPDKKFSEVLEFVSCLFPCPSVRKVTSTNVDSLLCFSDEYNVYDLRKRCEDYLTLQLQSSSDDNKLLDLLELACKHKLLPVIKTAMPRAALLPLDEIKGRKSDLPQVVLTKLYEMKLDLVERRERSEHRWAGIVNGPNPIFCESCGSRITKTCHRCRQFVCQSCATSEPRLTFCPICATCDSYFPLVTLSTAGNAFTAPRNRTNSNGSTGCLPPCKCFFIFDEAMAKAVVDLC